MSQYFTFGRARLLCINNLQLSESTGISFYFINLLPAFYVAKKFLLPFSPASWLSVVQEIYFCSSALTLSLKCWEWIQWKLRVLVRDWVWYVSDRVELLKEILRPIRLSDLGYHSSKESLPALLSFPQLQEASEKYVMRACCDLEGLCSPVLLSAISKCLCFRGAISTLLLCS